MNSGQFWLTTTASDSRRMSAMVAHRISLICGSWRWRYSRLLPRHLGQMDVGIVNDSVDAFLPKRANQVDDRTFAQIEKQRIRQAARWDQS